MAQDSSKREAGQALRVFSERRASIKRAERSSGPNLSIPHLLMEQHESTQRRILGVAMSCFPQLFPKPGSSTPRPCRKELSSPPSLPPRRRTHSLVPSRPSRASPPLQSPGSSRGPGWWWNSWALPADRVQHRRGRRRSEDLEGTALPPFGTPSSTTAAERYKASAGRPS